MADCYFDGNGCLVCPAVQGTPAEPARTEYVPDFGWNAGANSATRLSSQSLHTRFAMGQAIGVAVGLAKPPRVDVGDPNNIDHGLYFYVAADANVVRVVERGVHKGDPIDRLYSDEWEIRRVGSTVSYYRWRGLNRTLIYRSQVPSFGPVLVGTALFATGDRVI